VSEFISRERRECELGKDLRTVPYHMRSTAKAVGQQRVAGDGTVGFQSSHYYTDAVAFRYNFRPIEVTLLISF
jgi:hypothetical protein